MKIIGITGFCILIIIFLLHKPKEQEEFIPSYEVIERVSEQDRLDVLAEEKQFTRKKK